MFVAGTQLGAMTITSSGTAAAFSGHEAHALRAGDVADLMRISHHVRSRRAAERPRRIETARHKLLSICTCASMKPGATNEPCRSIRFSRPDIRFPARDSPAD
jgi:hypothetical protein